MKGSYEDFVNQILKPSKATEDADTEEHTITKHEYESMVQEEKPEQPRVIDKTILKSCVEELINNHRTEFETLVKAAHDKANLSYDYEWLNNVASHRR